MWFSGVKAKSSDTFASRYDRDKTINMSKRHNNRRNEKSCKTQGQELTTAIDDASGQRSVPGEIAERHIMYPFGRAPARPPLQVPIPYYYHPPYPTPYAANYQHNHYTPYPFGGISMRGRKRGESNNVQKFKIDRADNAWIPENPSLLPIQHEKEKIRSAPYRKLMDETLPSKEKGSLVHTEDIEINQPQARLQTSSTKTNLEEPYFTINGKEEEEEELDDDEADDDEEYKEGEELDDGEGEDDFDDDDDDAGDQTCNDRLVGQSLSSMQDSKEGTDNQKLMKQGESTDSFNSIGHMDDEDLLIFDDPGIADELAEELKMLLHDSEHDTWLLDFDAPSLQTIDRSNRKQDESKGISHGRAENEHVMKKSDRKQFSPPPSPTVNNVVYDANNQLQSAAIDRQTNKTQSYFQSCDLSLGNYDTEHLRYNFSYFGYAPQDSSKKNWICRSSESEAQITDGLGNSSQATNDLTINSDPAKVNNEHANSNSSEEKCDETKNNQVLQHRQRSEVSNLLSKFYQVLVQQAVLAVRRADSKKKITNESSRISTGSETHDDLAQILDGAVGMLQELEELRKDGIRNILLFEDQQEKPERYHKSFPGILDDQGTKKYNSEYVRNNSTSTKNLSEPTETALSKAAHQSGNESNNTQKKNGHKTCKRRILTRAAFMKMLQERYDRMLGSKTAEASRSPFGAKKSPYPGTLFDIDGLARLKSAFQCMDESVSKRKNGSAVHILEPTDVSLSSID